MKLGHHRPLRLEQLEDRLTPSLVITDVSGNLIISGTPTDTTPGPGLQITGQANGAFQVTDGARNLGSYRVTSNLEVLLASHPNQILVNLAGLPGSKYGGNVLINVGIGSTNSSADEPVQIVGGTVGGNVTLLGGSGAEDFELGVLGPFDTGTVDPVNVGGSVTVTSKSAVEVAPNFDIGNVLQLGPGSSVGGSITGSHVDQFVLGTANFPGNTLLTSVGQSVTINDAGSPTALLALINGHVGGNLSITGTGRADALTGFGDFIQLSANGVPGGGVVQGSLTINLGGNSVPSALVNNVLLTDGAVVNGNVTVSNNNSSINGLAFGIAPPLGTPPGAPSTINGSLFLNLGNGDNTVTLQTADAGDGGMTINGNVAVTAGNGDNQFLFSSPVFGSVRFQVGNGNDSATISGPVSGPVSWFSGNGNDSVTVGSGTLNYFLNMVFGTGNDTLTLATGGVVQGSAYASGPPAVNVFNQGGATLQNFTLVNF